MNKLHNFVFSTIFYSLILYYKKMNLENSQFFFLNSNIWKALVQHDCVMYLFMQRDKDLCQKQLKKNTFYF